MADRSPTLPIGQGTLALAGARPVLVVDPDEALLQYVLDACIRCGPAVATPGVETLRDEAAAREESVAGALDLPHPVADTGLGTVRVVAREQVLEKVLDGFHAASHAAALVEAGALSLATIQAREPSPLLISDTTAAVVAPSASAAAEPFAAVRERNVETVSAMRDLWETRLDGADAYPLRTPSRRSLFGAFAGRCDVEVAAELLRLLDAVSEVDRGDPCDHLDCVYAAGARCGAVNYGLRRAAEDCGIASPATLSSVKAAFEVAGLIETESVPRRVGRPRQRIVAADDRLADAAPDEVSEVVAVAKTDEGEDGGDVAAGNADGREDHATSDVGPVADDDA